MIRVFPRKTTWTPTDSMAFVGMPKNPIYLAAKYHDHVVKISVTFTWDIPLAEKLYRAWSQVSPHVEMGGPAFESPAGDFIPGMFLKQGITITSRGCSKECDFCLVPKREGRIRELPFYPGNNVADNNLLACSDSHVIRVFEMLRTQKAVRFSGGLDATMFQAWHGDMLRTLDLEYAYFACDSPGGIEPLERIVPWLSGFHRNQKRCYVLIGFSGESIGAAERRIERVFELGFLPFAMLYRPSTETIKGKPSREWQDFRRYWSKPAIYGKRMREKYGP